MDLRFDDRRVLITGSSRGIGHAIAAAFAAGRARVMLTGRSTDTLDAAVAGLRSEFGADRVFGTAGDLTEPAAVRALAAEVTAVWGGLDILVLNLGSGRTAPTLDVEPDEWNRMLTINLVSAMDTLSHAGPLLRRGREAAVVMIGSIAGLEDIGAPVAYAAAKAALASAMKCAARTLAADGIRVNMVAPGHILVRGGIWDSRYAGDPRGVQQMLDANVPLKRFGTAGEVAAAVLFLASPAAAFITGACLVVDGGHTHGV